MKSCSAVSPSTMGSISTSLFPVPTSKVIKYLLSNENWLVLANKSLKSHLPMKKKFKEPNSPNSSSHIFPLCFGFRGKICLDNPSTAAFSREVWTDHRKGSAWLWLPKSLHGPLGNNSGSRVWALNTAAAPDCFVFINKIIAVKTGSLNLNFPSNC